MREEFTKKDLENRMVVETLDCSKGIVIDDMIIFKDGYIKLRNYQDDLTVAGDNFLNIHKVYKKISFLDEINNTEIIWRRQDDKLVELTLEDIQEILGYRIRIVS